jgi:hypothetical protein
VRADKRQTVVPRFVRTLRNGASCGEGQSIVAKIGEFKGELRTIVEIVTEERSEQEEQTKFRNQKQTDKKTRCQAS